MIALAYHIRSLRLTSSVVYVVVTTPSALAVWSVAKTLSFILPRKIGNAGDELFYAMFQRMLLFLFEDMTGTQIYFHGDIPQKSEKENAILLFNHQCTSDWIMASSLGVRCGSVGIVRYVLKESLKYIPFYGFYLKEHGCVYVNRENFIEMKMKKQMEQYANKKYWMVIFPEGTRFNPQLASVLTKSQEYAHANGLAPLSQVLTPRSKGFEMCLKHLADPKYILDVTIMYGNTSKFVDGQMTRLKSPSLFDFLRGKCSEVHIHMTRIPVTSLPTETEKLKHWLHGRFLAKDRLLEEFYSKEATEKVSTGQLVPLGVMATVPSFLFFLGVNTLLLSTKTGRKIYLASLICGSLLTATNIIFRK